MQSLSNKYGSNSGGVVESDDFHSEEAIGWDADLSLDRFVENKNISSKLIRLARRRVPLSTIIFKYNIKFTQRLSMTGWTHTACCPFPDHKDSTPSFSFNSKDNCFNCFGCQRAGGSVDFLAGMSGKLALDIAKELLLSIYQNNSSIIDEIDDSENDKSDEILMNFSYKIHDFLQKNKDNSKSLPFVETLLWNLDMYLSKHTMIGSIDIYELEERISILESFLSTFPES